jgi:hypothetical protein
MPNEPSHRPHKIERVKYTDHRGRERTRTIVQYARSPQAEKDAENSRLGSLAQLRPTTDPTVEQYLCHRNLIFISPWDVARHIIRTRLERDAQLHKLLTGTDILKSYLDRSGDASITLREGFSAYHQLYILFGYIEAPNSYLPSLITQLVGQRYHEQKHCWLFMPRDLGEMVATWTPAIGDLIYLKRTTLPKLHDYQSLPGPIVNTPVRKPEHPPTHDDTQRNINTDQKFKPREDYGRGSRRQGYH